MTVIDGEIVIERPVEDVFDFVADERNEPRFNSRMSRVELVTVEPVGAGSRFLAESRMMGRTFDVTVEYKSSSGHDSSDRRRARHPEAAKVDRSSSRGA